MKSANVCSMCGGTMVSNQSPAQSRIVIVSEYPGSAELRLKLPFVGEAGNILKAEMSKVGLQFSECAVTNIWPHEPNEDEDKLTYHQKIAIQFASSYPYLLLLGSLAAESFLGMKVSKISGVVLSNSAHSIIVASPNPAMCLRGAGLGELRLALSNFAEAVQYTEKRSQKSRKKR